ncbi:unnamed protein product [Zymoseptoria tritici ST99CH_3D1]|nr:unnamed protein product [Zymoseptoria tritici ST99CH_3D1]
MAARTIEYIWKITRPKDEAIARALMHAAYQTAVQTDPNTTQVLIRSYVDTSTKTRGMHRPDVSGSWPRWRKSAFVSGPRMCSLGKDTSIESSICLMAYQRFYCSVHHRRRDSQVCFGDSSTLDFTYHGGTT